MLLATRLLAGCLPLGLLIYRCSSLLQHHTHLPMLVPRQRRGTRLGCYWLRLAVLVPLRTPLPPAGGSFEMDGSLEEQDPWGSTAPAFGMPQAPARGSGSSWGSPAALSGGSQAGAPVQLAGMSPLPVGTPTHRAPEDAGFGSPGRAKME